LNHDSIFYFWGNLVSFIKYARTAIGDVSKKDVKMKKSETKTTIPLRNEREVFLPVVVVWRSRVLLFAVVLVALSGWFSFCAQNVASDQSSVPTNEASPFQELTASETAWGTFKVGSWVRTRTITTTFQEKVSQSIAESTTILEAIEPDSILLKQIDSVEIGGKMVPGEPQSRKIDFYQQTLTGSGTVQALPPEEITVGNRKILCGVRVYEQTTSQFRRRTTVWFNPKVAPYVLRTEATRTSLPTPEQPAEKLLGHSISVVLNPPRTTLRGSFFGTYRVQTVRKNTDGTVYSLADCSLRVPGGIENERSWEYDRENNLIRTKTTLFSDTVKNSEAKPTEAVVGRQPSVVGRQ